MADNQSISSSPIVRHKSTCETGEELGAEPSLFSLPSSLDMDWTTIGGLTDHYDPYGDLDAIVGTQNTIAATPRGALVSNGGLLLSSPSDVGVDLLDLDLDLERMFNSLKDPNTPVSTETPSSSTFSQWDEPSSSTLCILACTKMVGFLETHLKHKPLALDEAMHVNQAALREINRIIITPDYSQSASCPQIIFIAMDQIITLFEHSIRPKGFPPHKLCTLVHLRFGAFEVDAEELMTLGPHIICRELRRALLALKTLSVALQQGSTKGDPGDARYELWSIDMARRLEALVGSVEEAWKQQRLRIQGSFPLRSV